MWTSFVFLLLLAPAAVLEARGPAPSPCQSVAYLDVSIEEMRNVAARRAWATRPLVISYTVQEGDTVWSISQRFDLDIDTIRWSNPELERNPDYLRPGTELAILPVRGIYHLVQAGDTLAGLARRYGVSVEDIVNFPTNHLHSAQDTLQAGRWIIIPHGTKNVERPRPSLSPGYLFAWPIVGRVTQGYSARHRAVDIGAPYGSKVYAARAGTVVHAGWSETGYGYTLIIDHGDGYSTLYSHLKGTWVSAGQRVARGALIGEVGSTGNSTGPHVHFEIRESNVRVNPLSYLPPQ